MSPFNVGHQTALVAAFNGQVPNNTPHHGGGHPFGTRPLPFWRFAVAVWRR